MFRPSAFPFTAQEITLCVHVFTAYFFRWEKDGQVSREVWLKAGEQGLLGVNTPAEHGGIGGDWLDATVVLEEQ